MVPPTIGLAIRPCGRCGLAIAESHAPRWPDARHVLRTVAAVVRLSLATLILLGLGVAAAGLAHAAAMAVPEMPSRPAVPRLMAAGILVLCSGLFIGLIATATLPHRRSLAVGTLVAVWTLLATAYLEASIASNPRDAGLAIATGAAIGVVAALATGPWALLFRFVGRFDHLLPWRA